MLELINIWKRATPGTKRRWMLAGANVELPRRRRIALLGANKEENETVLKIMSGLEPPDKGAVRHSGVACWPFGVITFMDITGSFQQNANFLGHLYGYDGGEIAAVAEALSGMKPKKGRPLRTYSSRDRRQMGLGLTLALQFDWYFINEKLPPTPPETAEIIDEAIADRVSRGGVIWATTTVDAVADYCDAGLVLDRGRLTFYNDLTEASEAFRKATAPRVGKRNER